MAEAKLVNYVDRLLFTEQERIQYLLGGKNKQKAISFKFIID